MADMAISVVWFASIIAGMVLTILLSKVFAEPPVDEVRQNETASMPSEEMLPFEVLQERRPSLVRVEEEARITTS